MDDQACHALATDIFLWTGRSVVVVVREGRFHLESGLPVNSTLTPMAGTVDEVATVWRDELQRQGLMQRFLFDAR